jgi:hypothetical protein
MVAPASLNCECIDLDIPLVDGMIFESNDGTSGETVKHIMQVGEKVTLREFAEEG